jgi:hypothetical protein
MIRNCKVCERYQHEEIGDSDFGAIYAETPSCNKYYDMDEEENEIKGFDREIERDCCVLDFFKVADIDKEIGDLFDPMDIDEDSIMDRAYARFREKYGIT